MGGYVYLICDPATDYYKIGVTRGKIEDRIKKLQTGNGTELHVVSYYFCEHPFKMEKLLHTKFTSKKVLNEWFCLSPEDVINFQDICKDTEDTINVLMKNPFFNKNIK